MATWGKFRFKDLVLVFSLVGLVAGISHFVISNPLGPSRLFYHAQSYILQWETRCLSNSPTWMSGVQRYAVRNMGAPSSQLVWISPNDDYYRCETGWRDKIFGKEPLQPDARFRFASATKTATAIIILNLINDERLELDDKIIDVLELTGGLKDPRVADISIEHLLSHRAGWDRVRTQDPMFMMGKEPWCPSNRNKLTETRLMYDPGEVESYSNLGYCLLGLAIEERTGRLFRDYVADYFNFSVNTLAFIDGPYKSGEPKYDFRHESFYMEDYYEDFDFQALSSSAGLSGSATDLARKIHKKRRTLLNPLI